MIRGLLVIASLIVSGITSGSAVSASEVESQRLQLFGQDFSNSIRIELEGKAGQERVYFSTCITDAYEQTNCEPIGDPEGYLYSSIVDEESIRKAHENGRELKLWASTSVLAGAMIWLSGGYRYIPFDRWFPRVFGGPSFLAILGVILPPAIAVILFKDTLREYTAEENHIPLNRKLYCPAPWDRDVENGRVEGDRDKTVLRDRKRIRGCLRAAKLGLDGIYKLDIPFTNLKDSLLEFLSNNS